MLQSEIGFKSVNAIVSALLHNGFQAEAAYSADVISFVKLKNRVLGSPDLQFMIIEMRILLLIMILCNVRVCLYVK